MYDSRCLRSNAFMCCCVYIFFSAFWLPRLNNNRCVWIVTHSNGFPNLLLLLLLFLLFFTASYTHSHLNIHYIDLLNTKCRLLLLLFGFFWLQIATIVLISYSLKILLTDLNWNQMASICSHFFFFGSLLFFFRCSRGIFHTER